MIVPFGFSVGDFIAAIGLTKDVISSLKGRGGAIEACYELLNELQTDCETLKRLQSTKLPSRYAADQTAIARQADKLHASALKLFQVIQQYEVDFRRPGTEKFYRAVNKKSKWALVMLDRIDRYRTDVQAQSLTLRLILERINL